MSILLVLWILLNSETSETFADSSLQFFFNWSSLLTQFTCAKAFKYLTDRTVNFVASAWEARFIETGDWPDIGQ